MFVVGVRWIFGLSKSKMEIILPQSLNELCEDTPQRTFPDPLYLFFHISLFLCWIDALKHYVGRACLHTCIYEHVLGHRACIGSNTVYLSEKSSRP